MSGKKKRQGKEPPLTPGHVVEGLVGPGLTVLSGPARTGKSCFALRLGLAVATGSRFLGRRVRRGRVVYVAPDRLALSYALANLARMTGDDLPKRLTAIWSGLDSTTMATRAADASLLIVDPLQIRSGSIEEKCLERVRQVAVGHDLAVLAVTEFDFESPDGSLNLCRNLPGKCGQLALRVFGRGCPQERIPIEFDPDRLRFGHYSLHW